MTPELYNKISEVNDLVVNISKIKTDLDERFSDWIELTTYSFDMTIFDINQKIEMDDFDEVLKSTDSMKNIGTNINDKVCLALKHKEKPLSYIISTFKMLDKKQNNLDSEITKQYYAQQQLFYSQMLANNGEISIAYFDMVDKDAFNDVFDK